MKLGITMLIYNKDDIQFVTEFPCFFGTPCTKQGKNNYDTKVNMTKTRRYEIKNDKGTMKQNKTEEGTMIRNQKGQMNDETK